MEIQGVTPKQLSRASRVAKPVDFRVSFFTDLLLLPQATRR
ncbi:MAG TPA: hypothetical protein VK619_13190 [Pyrinomonadaceae bacterium]|nr:hypothetical protein [Pyrinomonadaceae bacterium]